MKAYFIMPNSFARAMECFYQLYRRGRGSSLKVISLLCKGIQKKLGTLFLLIKILCNCLEMVLWLAKMPMLKALFGQKTNPWLQ